LTGWRVDIKSESEFAAEEAEQGYGEQLETSGRCSAVMSNGRRCPNAALPGSHYCGLEAHQALEVAGEDPAAAAAAEGPAS
jgi:N utilization substance protein A